MADIKLTLSANPTMRSPSIAEEARWLEDEGPIYYQLHAKPRRAAAGCWVYFIRQGSLVARAKAQDFCRMEEELFSYTGVPSSKASWSVQVIPPMELASHPIPHAGFQGFQYVRPEDQANFDNAFVGETVRAAMANGEHFTLPEEVEDPTTLVEGAVRRVSVNAYERSPEARRQCIAHYGTSCYVCGFNFAAIYGDAVQDFIHVHHLRLLSEIGEQYQVDPVQDLRPVCPNCHAVIHRRKPPYTIDEVQAMLKQSAE
jgi:hypothetical protein